ncbi:helix-turn-helix transcriptional regulator [Sulfurimonas crateris]|uniref:Helix-turn-helix transcriptional regulator n=1 Tax=Sulfurimonas crateris TaxID=2574727 RepID=A0A4U2Z3B3_9BACT|nr:helix-turn-helix transcriptional regulator [Sulfurimonas crateris]TKI68647.1 helix-turn-helix transcriptional regulator [Sulfurimonas crateris]
MFLSNASEEEIELLHKHISKNVKHYRLEREMSQLELALTIGLKSGAFFGNAENNTNYKHFNIEHIYKISKALNIPIAKFFEPVEDS